MHRSQSLINHVALVLDGSGSMGGHERKVIEVADAQIRHLALKSEELHQETRVSVYLFDDVVECLIFDMDVMRLPSIKDLYRVNGMTAMIDALVRSQMDLNTTSQIYGDHGFLTIVITDGLENASKVGNKWAVLCGHLNGLKPGWSVGFMVPKEDLYGGGRAGMQRMGVPAEFIQEWDTASPDGFAQAGAVATASMDSFMTMRAAGRGVMRSAFSTGADAVNTSTVKASLRALTYDRYLLTPVGAQDMRMDEAFSANGIHYQTGRGFYQFTKREAIQPQKQIVCVEKASGNAYSDPTPGSPAVRQMLGLPSDLTVKVSPDANPAYEIFVQSTAPNRKVLRGTKVLMLK